MHRVVAHLTESERVALYRVICTLAILLHIGAALLIAAEHPTAWSAESDGALPAAISYSVYQRPLGTIDSNVLASFTKILRDRHYTPAAINEAVLQTSWGDIATGGLLPTTRDGIGAGQPLFASFAMKLLGPRLSSLLYLYLTLMGGSMLIFVVRFRDDRLFVLPVLCTALSLILLRLMTVDQSIADQIPLGGNRFFGLLAVAPAIHLCFEIIEGNDDRSGDRTSLALTAIQAAILALAIFVRSSVAYLLVAVLLAAVLRWRTTRAGGEARGKFYRKLAAILVSCSVAIGAMLVSMSNYTTNGRAFGNVWHRAFISMSLHPDWPFGNLREIYDCTKEIPEGLNRRYEDRNGHCVWWIHVAKQGLSPVEASDGIYAAEYEAAMRRALFNVVWSYPRQAFEVYFVYKPLMLARTLVSALHIDVERSPPSVVAMLASQLVLAAALVICGVFSGRREVASRSAIFAPLFLLSMAPQFVAWSSFWTSPDVIVYMYANILVLAAFAIQTSGSALLRLNADSQSELTRI